MERILRQAACLCDSPKGVFKDFGGETVGGEGVLPADRWNEKRQRETEHGVTLGRESGHEAQALVPFFPLSTPCITSSFSMEI